MSRLISRAAVLVLPLVFSFSPLRADTTASFAAADAKIAAAQTPVDKLNALYQKAGVPLGFLVTTRADWETAGKALDELFRLLAAVEKDGKTKIEPKWQFYFRRGYIAEKLDNHAGAMLFYSDAERAGYLKDNADKKNKGSELFVNRGEAKAAAYLFTDALVDLNKAIAMIENGYWYKSRAETYFGMGDWENAAADWKKAIALEPSLKPLKDYSASFLDGKPAPQDDSEPPFDKNLLPFNKAIAANRASAAPFIERARYALRQARESRIRKEEHFKAALKDLDRAIDNEPENAATWRERGKVRGAYWNAQNGKNLEFNENAPLDDFTRALNLEENDALTRWETGKFLSERYQSAAIANLLERGNDKKEPRKLDLQNAIMNFSHAIVHAPNASADAHFKRAWAERLMEKPDLNTILVDYSAVIEQQMRGIGEAPDDGQRATSLAEAHLMRGKILLSRGARNAALKEFDASIETNSSDAKILYEARFERGKLRVLRGEYDAALEDLEFVTEKTRFAEAWLWQAGAHEGKGETEKAKADLQEGFKLDAKLKARVAGSRYDEANPTQKPLAPAPDKNDAKLPLSGTALEHKNAGNELINKGDEAGALAEYNNAILLDPNFADGYNNRGARYISQEKYDLALSDLNRAIEIDPKHRLAYFNRAAVWEKLLQKDKQRADLDRAVEYADTPARKADAYVARAKMRLRNDKTGGFNDFALAKEQAGNDAAVWSNIGFGEFALFQFEEAARTFGHAVELAPNRTQDSLYRALNLFLADDKDASTALETALHGIKAGDLAAAKNDIATLLRQQPDSPKLKELQALLNQATAN